MKRLMTLAIAITAVAMSAWAQLGMFNHLGVDVSASTNGIGVEVATPITSWIQLRGGVSVMPKITFNTDIDGNIKVNQSGISVDRDINVEVSGDLSRTQGNVILNVYPFGPLSGFYIAGGAYFGGKKIVGVSGYSSEVASLQQQGILQQGWVEIGDYKLDFERDGRIVGGLVAKDFRPYLGIGFGRPCPGSRLGFIFEIGAQFMGKMKVCQGSDLTPIDLSNLNNDDDWQKVMDKLTVYPVIKFTLAGKIF